MDKVTLLPHQIAVMKQTAGFDNVADYVDMGGGKTFIGSEQMKRYGCTVNLIICQKSKIEDWIEHFKKYYAYVPRFVYDLTNKKQFADFLEHVSQAIDHSTECCFGVINYELAYRRPVLAKLEHFTLMLDESSMIQNEHAKRSKFVLQLHPEHVILLSGTPTAGKYERLWSQVRLLGWNIKKTTYYSQFVVQDFIDVDGSGFKIPVVIGYKNVDRLKRKLAEHGAVFMKAEEFGVDLPDMNEITVRVKTPAVYKRFMKDRVAWVEGKQLVGDTTLTMRMYARQICGQYNQSKLDAVRDLIESTDDRIIIFYNFNDELNKLLNIVEQLNRPAAVVNGEKKDLEPFVKYSDSVALIQYQAGAMGLNLQVANKVIYFTLPDRSELFEQSKARIHRIGQHRPCFYYYLMCPGTVETRVLETLKLRKDYTDALFKKDIEEN
jgi:SNF2 family DNA or RNA helicase